MDIFKITLKSNIIFIKINYFYKYQLLKYLLIQDNMLINILRNKVRNLK